MCRKAPSTMLRCFIWVMGTPGTLVLVPRGAGSHHRTSPSPRKREREEYDGSMDRHPSAEVRRDFYDRIGALGMTPLWEVLHALVPPQPAGPVAPAHWRYDAIR